MFKIITTAGFAVLLSACSSLPDWVSVPGFVWAGTDEALGHYSFDWHLSGERQVAPLQVFDDGNKIWLQFMPDQTLPAIFQSTPQGERPLRYTRDGDYVLLDGIWPKLSFRGGALVAYAERIKPADQAMANEPIAVSPSAAVPVAVDALSTISEDQAKSESPIKPETLAIAVGPSEDARRLTRASFLSSRATVLTPRYRVTLKDQNLRKALNRWALQASWTFSPEHWTVDVDIPISGEAIFGESFEDSVQDLLAATELAERPLRPCFYSNRVLRVVSYSQSCDRSTGVRES